MALSICDRCRVSGCCLNPLGKACKQARERECPNVVYTNADHIRDMTDEELGELIESGISSDPCDYCIYLRDWCYGEPCANKSALEVIVEWLQQPYKEELT